MTATRESYNDGPHMTDMIVAAVATVAEAVLFGVIVLGAVAGVVSLATGAIDI